MYSSIRKSCNNSKIFSCHHNVRMEVEDSGMVIYEFPEIISRFENE